MVLMNVVIPMQKQNKTCDILNEIDFENSKLSEMPTNS